MTRSRPRQIVCVLWRAPDLSYLNADRLTTNMLPPKMTSLYEGRTPSLFTFWSNLPYKSRIRVFFISYFFANERILSDVSHVSHNIFGITHYKTTTYFVRMYHTYCEKTSVRTPSAPRCHLPHQNNWFLPYYMQSKAHLNRKGRRHPIFQLQYEQPGRS